MINLREMLTETRTQESARRGCLMAMLSKEDSARIYQFGQKLITDEDLYQEGDEFGRESEGHVTIRYGFTRDLNELEIRRLLKDIKPFHMELINLSRFNNPKYGVIKFDAKSPVLTYLNHETGNFPNTTDFPNYHPHLTIAYVKPETHPELNKSVKLAVAVHTICYSAIKGTKSYFDLND